MSSKERYMVPSDVQQLWGIREEEKIRDLERKYRIHRGDTVTIRTVEQTDKREYGMKRTIYKRRKMKVIGVNTNHITLEGEKGFRESFQWQEFFKVLE